VGSETNVRECGPAVFLSLVDLVLADNAEEADLKIATIFRFSNADMTHLYTPREHTPPSTGTKPPPTGSGLSGQQNIDTPDVSTQAALHV
jgi:hypothetical protein